MCGRMCSAILPIEIRANTFCDGNILGNQQNMPQ
jgi:hypothetical protein